MSHPLLLLVHSADDVGIQYMQLYHQHHGLQPARLREECEAHGQNGNDVLCMEVSVVGYAARLLLMCAWQEYTDRWLIPNYMWMRCEACTEQAQHRQCHSSSPGSP